MIKNATSQALKNFIDGKISGEFQERKKFWIQEAIKKPGALRKQLKTKKGKKIPKKKLAEASKKKGKIGQRARLAQTLSTFKK